MSVQKDKIQGGFVIIPLSIVNDPNLSFQDVGMMTRLFSLPDSWKLSASGLCKGRKDGKEKTGGILNRLIDIGYVSRKQNRGESGRFGYMDIKVHEQVLHKKRVIECVTQAHSPTANTRI